MKRCIFYALFLGDKEDDMKRKMFYKKDYVKELLKIIRTETDTTKLPKLLSDYHEKDIAEAIT